MYAFSNDRLSSLLYFFFIEYPAICSLFKNDNIDLVCT